MLLIRVSAHTFIEHLPEAQGERRGLRTHESGRTESEQSTQGQRDEARTEGRGEDRAGATTKQEQCAGGRPRASSLRTRQLASPMFKINPTSSMLPDPEETPATPMLSYLATYRSARVRSVSK